MPGCGGRRVGCGFRALGRPAGALNPSVLVAGGDGLSAIAVAGAFYAK